MKKITVLFTKPVKFNLFSHAIMWGLKTPFSHVAVKILDTETNLQVIYQASGLWVNCVSEAHLCALDVIVYAHELSLEETHYLGGKTFLINQLGKPYGMKAVLGFAYKIVMHRFFHRRARNPNKPNGSEWVCSQLAAEFINITENTKYQIKEMSPLQIYNHVRKMKAA